MKRLFSISALIAVLLGTCALVAGFSGVTEEAYQRVLEAIDAWIATIPEGQYRQAEANDVFRWKVGLEETDPYSGERFIYYDTLLDEIEDRQFYYDNWQYDAKTIRYYQLDLYDCYYSEEVGSADVIEPNVFFADRYVFYKQSIISTPEQWVWLAGFFDFFNYGWYSGREEFVYSLISNSYNDISDILEQYIFVSGYFLDNNPDVIIQDRNLYSTLTTFYSSETPVDKVLKRLYNFVLLYKDHLEEDDKETILNFILPAYQDNDYAVKIYAELT